MRRPLLTLAAVVALAAPLSACGSSDDAASGCSPPTSQLAVGATDELKFDEERFETGAGCIDVTYTNEGQVPHTLLVKGEPGFKLSIGDTDRGTVDLTAGTYVLFCDVAGHEAAGMKADLIVR